MRSQLIIGFFLSLSFIQFAQGQEKGKVVVIKDPQIDSLISRRLELSRSESTGGSVSTSGFRVQIFSGLERENVYTEQTRFKSFYPGIRSYVSYSQPNYRLRVGDFRTRLEAQKFVNEIKKQYSTVFIFAERIIPR